MAKKAGKRAKAAAPKAKARRKPAAEAKAHEPRRPRVRRSGVPGTTVVHVDAETYALLQRERREEERGYGATLRRILTEAGHVLEGAAAPAESLA